MCEARVPKYADVFTYIPRKAPKTPQERSEYRKWLRRGWAEKQDTDAPRGMRQYCCGWASVGNAGLAGVRRSEESEYAYAYGVQHCGYKSCPVCAPKLAEGRRAEMERAIKGHMKRGGGVYTMLLTAPHINRDSLKDIQKGMQKAWTKTTRTDGPYKKTREHFGVRHWVRCEEILHTKNGWHVHYHLLMFTDYVLSETDQEILGDWFYSTWAAKVESQGMGQCDRRGFGIGAVRSPEATARYLSGDEHPKRDRAVSVSLEMTRGDLKTDRRAYLMGKRTPFEILADALEMDEGHDWALYREYTESMYRHMNIRWSNGAKKALGVAERTDEEILAEQREFNEERPLTPEELTLINEAHIPGRPRHSGMDYLLDRVGRYGMDEIDAFIDFQRAIQGMKNGP